MNRSSGPRQDETFHRLIKHEDERRPLFRLNNPSHYTFNFNKHFAKRPKPLYRCSAISFFPAQSPIWLSLLSPTSGSRYLPRVCCFSRPGTRYRNSASGDHCLVSNSSPVGTRWDWVSREGNTYMLPMMPKMAHESHNMGYSIAIFYDSLPAVRRR
jgi:hypothetical protein